MHTHCLTAETNKNVTYRVILLAILLAFDLLNYIITQYALSDVLGTLSFVGIKWATILSIVFCSIDLVIVAPLIRPSMSVDPGTYWYWLGAWFLIAAFNASLTWWGFSVAMPLQTATTFGNTIPILFAVLVLAVRILLGHKVLLLEGRFTASASNSK